MKIIIVFITIFITFSSFLLANSINIATFPLSRDHKEYLEMFEQKVYDRLFYLSNNVYGSKLNIYIEKLKKVSDKLQDVINKNRIIKGFISEDELEKKIFRLKLYYNINEIIKLILLKEDKIKNLSGGVICKGFDRKECNILKKIYKHTLSQLYSDSYLTNFDFFLLKKIPVYFILRDVGYKEKGKFYSWQYSIKLNNKFFRVSYPVKIEFYLTRQDINGLKKNNKDFFVFWETVIAHEIGHYIEEIKLLNKKNNFDNICRRNGVSICKKKDFVPSTNWFKVKYAGKKVVIGSGKSNNKIYIYYEYYLPNFDYYSMTNSSEDFAETFAYLSVLKKYEKDFSQAFKLKIYPLSEKLKKKFYFIRNNKTK